MAYTARLNAPTERMLTALAQRSGNTKIRVIQDALMLLGTAVLEPEALHHRVTLLTSMYEPITAEVTNG